MSKFEKGKSGNPAGKPKGTRHRTTIAVEALMQGEAEGLSRKAIELALAGDTVALKICLDRIAPPRRDAPVSFEAPEMENAADAVSALGSILKAVATGSLTPSEASNLSGLIDAFRRVLEAEDHEHRTAHWRQNEPSRQQA